MKINLFAFLIISTLFGCNQSTKLSENEYEVTVKAEGVFDGLRAYLKTNENPRNPIATDTAVVYKGGFTFKGQIEGTEMRSLTIDGVNGQTTLLLEAGNIEVVVYKDSIYKSTVKGSFNNAVFNDYKKQYKAKIDDLTSIKRSLMESQADPVISNSLKKEMDSLGTELKNFGFNFIKANTNADFSLLLLNRLIDQNGFDLTLASEAYDQIDNSVKIKTTNNQIISNRIKTKIKSAKKSELVTIGKIVPNFSAPNPQGELIELNKIKGKVTIIDFWASWCKPCRVENPNLVKLYNEYHPKGLEIISVSLDREAQKDFWIKAIEKDQLNWYNISNLKFWQEPIAKLYGVNSIPATFIIDENGILIAKKLRGAQLDQKIKELLD
jgi:thiol-disulfide isomerase/thioredoxin|tara:strand:- start:620 stop:1762 length:1143 start_codon:yes stop_codon:yes gene_type:complete